MNETEYEQFQWAVQRFYTGEKLEMMPQPSREPYFSSVPCDCCKRSIGGMRVECGPFSICLDCLYYTTYGALDDMTMLGISKGGTS